jgi:hypothetical protein
MLQPSRQSRLGRYETITFGGVAARAAALAAHPTNRRLQPAGDTAAGANGPESPRWCGVDPARHRLFLYMSVRKEALLSSQIEGTQSSLSDLLHFESDQAPGVPLDDVAEVSCYVAALNRGLELLRGGLPLSLHLIREIHALLLPSGRGAGKQPGELRSSKN